jgi:hypothetical protein
MNTSKFSLADLLCVLTALGYSFICYLGFNFNSIGNIESSLFKAFLAFLLLFSAAFGAKMLKQTTKNFKPSFVLEVIVLVIFTLLILLYTTTAFSHYFAVSERKQDIQEKLIGSINSAESMFIYYESYVQDRKKNDEYRLNLIVANKNSYPTDYDNEFTNNGMTDQNQIKEKMFKLNADLLPSNYNNMKVEYQKWITDSKSSVKQWKSMGVVAVVKSLDEKVPLWKSTLVTFSKSGSDIANADPFNPTLQFDSVKSMLSTDYPNTSISWLFGLIVWLLMLFPYFLAKRDGKRLVSVEKYEVVL